MKAKIDLSCLKHDLEDELNTNKNGSIDVNASAADTKRHEGDFHIPISMRKTTQWIVFRGEWGENKGKMKKVPKYPGFKYGGKIVNCSPTDPNNGVDFETAMNFVDCSRDKLGEKQGADGVGFIFTPNDDFFGVDYDDVYDHKTGEIQQWVADAVDTLDTYHEVSVSGTGLHAIGEGEISADYMNKNDEIGFEIYSEDRFFTISGRHLTGTPKTVNKCDSQAQELQRKYLDERSESQKSVSSSDVDIDPRTARKSKNFTRKEQHLVNTACRSQDGDFKTLWEGDWESIPRFKSQSQADKSFLQKLAYWTNGREDVMDCIYRESGLMRTKWDDRRNESTYGAYEIAKAKQANTDRCTRFYASGDN